MTDSRTPPPANPEEGTLALERRKQTLDFWKTVIVSGLLATGATVLGSWFTYQQQTKEIRLKEVVNAQQYRLKALELEQAHLARLSEQILSGPQPTARALAQFMMHLSEKPEVRERWQAYLAGVEEQIRQIEAARAQEESAQAEAERLREERLAQQQQIVALSRALDARKDETGGALEAAVRKLEQAEAKLDELSRRSRAKDEELKSLRAAVRQQSVGTVSAPPVQQAAPSANTVSDRELVNSPQYASSLYLDILIRDLQEGRPLERFAFASSFPDSERRKLQNEARFVRDMGTLRGHRLVGERGRTMIHQADFANGSLIWELEMTADNLIVDIDYYPLPDREQAVPR